MPFHYSRHILKRMREREITQEQIEQTVTHPDYSIYSFQERQLAEKSFYGRLLHVVYVRLGDKIILITTYWREGE